MTWTSRELLRGKRGGDAGVEVEVGEEVDVEVEERRVLSGAHRDARSSAVYI